MTSMTETEQKLVSEESWFLLKDGLFSLQYMDKYVMCNLRSGL